MASTVLKNAGIGYRYLSWCSQVFILVSFITIIQVKSDIAIESLDPSPSITSRRDQLQTSLPSSAFNQKRELYLYSTFFTDDDQSLSSILTHQTSTPDLATVLSTTVLSDSVPLLLETNMTETVQQTRHITEKTLIATVSEISTTEPNQSLLPTSTLSVGSSLTSTAADELFLIYDHSSLEIVTVSSSNFMVSAVEQQLYSENEMPALTLQPLESTEIESVSLLSSLEYYSSANTQMSNVDIGSPSFYIDDSSLVMSENYQDLVLQAASSSSSFQFQAANVLSLESGGSTTVISHELLSTVRPTIDFSDFLFYTDLKDYLPSNSVEIIHQKATPGLETSDVITEMLAIMSPDIPYLDATSIMSDMSVSNIDDYSVEDIKPTTTPELETSDIITGMLSIMSSDSPYLDVTSIISDIVDDYLPSGSVEDIQPTTTTPELETSDIIIEMLSIMSSDSPSYLDVTSTISDMSVSNMVDDTMSSLFLQLQMLSSSKWVDSSVTYIEDALNFSTESISGTILSGQPSPSEFQMSSLPTYSTKTLIGEQIVSSQFQTPSLVSIETDVSTIISGYSFVQETPSSVEFNDLETIEPIILCFTTIISLPYSIETIQPSATPDITPSSTVQSLAVTEYGYSTEAYTHGNGLISKLTEFDINLSTMNDFSRKSVSNTYLVQNSAINFQTPIASKHSSLEDTYSTTQLPDSGSSSFMSEANRNPSIKMASFHSTPVTISEVLPNSLDVLHFMKREAVAVLTTQTQTVNPQTQLISNILNPSLSSDIFIEPLTSIMSTDTVLPSETITDKSSLLLSEKYQTLTSTLITTDQISEVLYNSENQMVSTTTGSLLNLNETPNISELLESSVENIESTILHVTEFSVNTEELFATSLITSNSYATPTNFVSTTLSPTFTETPTMSRNVSEIASIDVSSTASEFYSIQTLLPTLSNIDDTYYSPTYQVSYTSTNLLPSLSTLISNRHFSTVSDAYATNAFSGMDILTLLPSSPNVHSVEMSSNSISVSFGEIYGTTESLTSSPLLPTSSKLPPLTNNSMVVEASSNYSPPSMKSISLSEISLVPIFISSSIPEYLEETYVTCTTIYPDIFETSMEVSGEIYVTSDVEILTMTPEITSFQKLLGSSSITIVNSATFPGTMTSAAQIETTPSIDSFLSLPLEDFTMFTFPFQETSDSEFIKSTVSPTFTMSDFLLSSQSIDIQSSSGEPFQSYTSGMLKTTSLPITSGFLELPETSFVTSILPSSSVTSIPSSSPSAASTTNRLPVDISVTTKMPYVSLDTSFATQSSWLQVVIEVATSVDTKSIDFLISIESSLASAYIQARNKELGLRRRRAVTVDGITAQQIDISRDDSSSESLSVVYYITEGGNRIPASESSITMQHLSTEALSVELGYPVKSQVAVYDQSTSSSSKIWIVAVVCGALAFIFLVCCCFCWCCRPRPKDGNFDPETLKFLQFKQKYPYHSYAASKRRQGATSPTGAHNSQTQFLEDERSIKTSDYHTDEDDSVRIKKKQPIAPPRMPSRTKALVSRQDDTISESDSFVSSTEDELKMSSSVSSQRQLRPTSSKHEQIKEPKVAMFSHVSGQQMSKPKKLQRTMEEAKKQKDSEAEWRKAQAEISAILEPEVVKTQALTTFIAPQKRKKKIKDKKQKIKSSQGSSSVDETELEEDGRYSSLPDVHYARPLASENEPSLVEPSSLGQTRKRMHALLDEAFSLVNLPQAGKNTVRPLQATNDQPNMKYCKKPKPRERRRQRFSSVETHTGSETDDSVFRSRHPFAKPQQSAPVGHQSKDGFTQTKTDSGKVVIVPVTQLADDTGGLVWSIYDAEDEMSRLTPTMEPATMPGGLDPSPPVTLRSPSGALLTLPHLSMLPESELSHRSGPPVPLKLFGKTKNPGYMEEETSFQQPYPTKPYWDRESLREGATQQTRPSANMLDTLEKEKRIGKPVDDSFDELNVTAIIKGAETSQPLMKVIKEELERLAKLRPHTYEDKD